MITARTILGTLVAFGLTLPLFVMAAPFCILEWVGDRLVAFTRFVSDHIEWADDYADWCANLGRRIAGQPQEPKWTVTKHEKLYSDLRTRNYDLGHLVREAAKPSPAYQHTKVDPEKYEALSEDQP